MLYFSPFMPAYGGPESFLNNVVAPIYTVIQEEAMKSKNGTTDHSIWRNYDDLNEYFWSPYCFQIGWLMRLVHNFFCTKLPRDKEALESSKAKEIRGIRRRRGRRRGRGRRIWGRDD
ncbi:putative callose synthase 8 isoform X3 [Humulus lupulus]|uniref:putative callose synthase 8 isoform X3 n=1 Tax=Humulus lupulus TaxID=3486 RepID=UPI002B4152C1|nr:putative callose synthase 8 isoform X3 [Humulus lupulus]